MQRKGKKMNELIQLGRETFEFGSRGLKRLNRRLLAMDASSPGKPLLQKISRKRMEGMQRAKGRKPADPRKLKRNSGGVRKVGKYMRDADDRIVGLA